MDGVSHAEVAVHADRREEGGAVVDGHVEDEAGQRAEGVGHVPHHVVHGLLHLKGQEEEEEEVGDGQVEEEDVDRRGLLPHLLAEGVEGEDVGGEAQHEGDDVDGQTQAGVAVLHGGNRCNSLNPSLSQSGIKMCRIMSLTLTRGVGVVEHAAARGG